jgi:hypothetical protein
VASGRKRKAAPDSLLARAARQGETDAERAELEAWLDTIPGGYNLRPDVRAALLDILHHPNTSYQQQRGAARMLAKHDLNDVVDVSGRRPKPTNEARTKSKRQHGKRHDDAAVFDAVARALAAGVKGLGRLPEAHRPASGYELWRLGQADGDDLPRGRRIRQRFGPRQTKRDRDVWATVVRLGRKSGHIT